METMRKFKVGDEIVRVDTKASWAHIGYTAAVLEGYQYLGKDFCVKRIFDHQWELVQEAAKSKWTIYNNTLPWSDLSDKKKGKLMVAAHAKIRFTCNKLDVFGDVAFNEEGGIYKAQYIEPVKPEPTMEEKFNAAWERLNTRLSIAEQMINKGLKR
jgi:hypothetical protein